MEGSTLSGIPRAYTNATVDLKAIPFHLPKADAVVRPGAVNQTYRGGWPHLRHFVVWPNLSVCRDYARAWLVQAKVRFSNHLVGGWRH